MTELKAWYTLREYAEMTGENIETVRSQNKRGTLPTSLKDGRWVIYLDSIAAERPDLWGSLCRVSAAKKNGAKRP